ncbi:MAG: NAD-dependent deacylase [Gammaproteobacteria bacterium]|nr:NAD-dependent deacylase [Gammaproteobacteria bacterium]
MTVPRALVNRLRAARHLLILTGSGVSAASGIPTFRAAGTGLWARFRPDELATPEAFARDPALVWQWYCWRRDLVNAAEPNAAHHAIAELQRRLSRVTLVTQNVDGLHQRAGSSDVIEFHGNIHRNRCPQHGVINLDREPRDKPPPCPDCGDNLRPDVVWFGETIPEQSLSASLAAASDCDLMLIAGTASVVYPAAGLAELAKANGAWLIEANTETTPLSAMADCELRGSAADSLPAVIQALDGA